MGNVTMNAKDALSASLAECYVTIEKKRYHLFQAKNVEIKYEKTKVEVPILGKTTNGNKSVGGKISGSMTIYFNTDIFTNLIKKYKNTGEDLYFDMLITNEDKTSASGERRIIVNDCNIDSAIIAAFDADGKLLEQNVDFTAEDFDLEKAFKILKGMK